MARRTTESAGSWYWLARGSGVWLNLGRTYIDPEQRGESDWFFKKGGRLVRHLANEGLDTLQFPRLAGTSTYTGAPVNNDRFELVALREKPGLRGTCADVFRAGWDHDRACTCVEKVGVVNCRGASQLLTVRTGQHSFMRNVTFASLEPPLAPGEPLAAYLEHVYHEPPREPLQLTSLQWFWWGAPLRVDCSWPHAGPKELVCTPNATAGAVDVSPNLGLSLLGKYGFTVPSWRQCRDSTSDPAPHVGADSASSTMVVSGPIEVMRISTALYRRGHSRLPKNYTRRLGREGGSNGCWVR